MQANTVAFTPGSVIGTVTGDSLIRSRLLGLQQPSRSSEFQE